MFIIMRNTRNVLSHVKEQKITESKELSPIYFGKEAWSSESLVGGAMDPGDTS